MIRVALTGGPCAGKTSTLDEIRREFGDDVSIAPEPATMLFSSGFPVPGRDLTYSETWQHLFQHTISPLHFSLEEVFKLVAEQRGTRMLVCDRGLLDGAAYYPGGLSRFIEEFNLDLDTVYERYDMVIHLESTATCAPHLYGKAGNQDRYESLEEAIALEGRTRDVWRGHPNWKFVSGSGGIKQVIAQVISLLSEYLDVEVERKFFLYGIPSAIHQATKVLHVEQGYMETPTGEFRVRKMGKEFFQTVKGEGNLSRREWECSIPEHVFEFFWPMTENRRIDKTRYFIPHGKYMLELDVYHGDLDGLITMECEFHTEEESLTYVLPDWADEAEDITSDPGFKNRNLALYGLK